MNSVHLVTQEKYRVKQGQNRLSAPSAQPIGPAARLGRAQAAQPTCPVRLLAPLACLLRARAARLQRVPACRAPLPHACPVSACCVRPMLPLALRAQRPCAHSPNAPTQPLAQLGSSPSRFCTFFFSATGKYQKYIYLFSFIFQYTNKFIKIYFIYIIIFFFFHSSTNQINCLNLFYLFSCSNLHIVNSKVCFPTCLCVIYLSTQTFTSHIQHVIHTKHIHTTIHQST